MKELDQLKHLLVGRECRDLEGLQARVDDPARRARDVAEVLPEAIRVGVHDGERLADALQEPVGHCIRRSIERDSRAFADALFPVMGPAIRRAISETLKSFVQSINQAVEHSLSLRGLLWRWEALRGGVPFAAVVLKHTLVFRVEAAYLIQNDSGLLIDHVVAATHTTLKDEDAVSAMLTAIEDFVEDAFAGVGEGGLESVEIGERTLWLIKGPDASLACLISGLPPVELRTRLESVLAEVHAVYGPELAAFKGDKTELDGVAVLLERGLTLEFRETGELSRRSPALWPWALATVLALTAGGYFWWHEHEHQQRLLAVKQRLDAQPGILVLDWQEDGGSVAASLLRDPLALEAASLLAQDPGVAGRVRFTVAPFQSLEPPLVLERSRRLLRAPEGVELRLEGSTLYAVGMGPSDWLERARASLVLPPGVETLDLSGVTADLSGLPVAVHRALQPPSGVTLSISGRSLSIGGSAPWEWINGISGRLRRIDLLESCELRGLAAEEWDEAKRLIAELEGSPVFFSEGDNPAPRAEPVVRRAAQIIDRLGALDATLRLGLRLRVVGRSDGVGSESWNRWLRRQRAVLVRDALIDEGAVPDLLTVDLQEEFRPSPTPVPTLRRVDFSVSATPPTMPICLP